MGKPSSEASFDPLIALKVVTLTTTKSAVFGAWVLNTTFQTVGALRKRSKSKPLPKVPFPAPTTGHFHPDWLGVVAWLKDICGFCSTGRVFSIAWGFSPQEASDSVPLSTFFWSWDLAALKLQWSGRWKVFKWWPWLSLGWEVGSCVAIWCDLCCLGLPGLQAFKDSAVQVSDASMTMVLRNFLPPKEVEVSEGYGSWRLSLLGYLVLFGIYITK